MKRTIAVFVSLLSLIFTQMILSVKGQNVQSSFKFGFVKEFDFSDDSIWLANTKKKDRVDSKSIAILGYNGLGTININGRDTDLKLTSDNLPEKNFKIGQGGYQTWKGRNVTVRLDYIFTWLCPPKDEQCEVYYYKGILDISYKGKRKKVNITGFGGS